MSFRNTALLAGLAVIAIPIIIHFLSRRAAKVLDWGAMLFLMDSVESRKRRIQLEEALLLAARCLLMGLVALAVARPFVPPGSSIPWVIVLPGFLLALVALTTAIVLRGSRKWFAILLGTAVLLMAGSVASVVFERMWNLKRFGTAGGRDIALIIDSSTSMQLRSGSGTVFDAAVAEARQIVEKAPAGSSFSIILGGPVPQAVLPEPVVNRNDIAQALTDLKPLHGRMAAFDALATASVSLSRGSNPNKDIVILTDGQNIGWELENKARWEAMLSGMETLPGKPRVILRRFPLPATFRNAAIGSIRYSRDLVGTDRPVSIEVTVENTGTEAITPEAVEVKIGDDVLTDPGVGQLAPGAKQTVRFAWQFKDPGSYTVEAAVTVRDDLAMDDRSVSVCQVVDRLGILIVDGNPVPRFLDRASAFTALALAPATLLTGNGEAGEKREKAAVTLDPEVLPITRAGSVESWEKYDVIILADVAKLPDSVARRIAAWVQAGGGLLILPGPHASPDFYANWLDERGNAFVPARLGSEAILTEPVSPALNTFTGDVLSAVSDPKQSDFGGALLNRYWKLLPDTPGGAFVAGRLGNGDPFLTGRRAGFGMVLMAACNPDGATGNLPTRQSFVPFIHQVVYQLASPDGQPLNCAPALQVNLPLSTTQAAGGLKGEYFRGRQTTDPVLVRIDARPDFNYGSNRPGPGVPADFSARWTGAIVPRYSEEYVFDGWGDDSMSLWIGEKRLIDRGGEGRITLEAGRYYPIRIEFFDNNDGAAMQVYWRSNSQNREVLPESCLTPFAPDDEAGETTVGSLTVGGPDGRPREAALVFTRGGLVARLGSDLVPGLYHLQIPESRRDSYARLLAKDGTVPFTITDDSGESRLTSLGPPELEFLRKRLPLMEPANAADVLTILSGREFGEELWKYLAAGALFLLLAEIALTRWIAVSRRAGDEAPLDLENRFAPSAGFQEQLNRVKEVAVSE